MKMPEGKIRSILNQQERVESEFYNEQEIPYKERVSIAMGNAPKVIKYANYVSIVEDLLRNHGLEKLKNMSETELQQLCGKDYLADTVMGLCIYLEENKEDIKKETN